MFQFVGPPNAVIVGIPGQVDVDALLPNLSYVRKSLVQITSGIADDAAIKAKQRMVVAKFHRTETSLKHLLENPPKGSFHLPDIMAIFGGFVYILQGFLFEKYLRICHISNIETKQIMHDCLIGAVINFAAGSRLRSCGSR